MHAYLANVLRSHDCETLIVGGASDHMHALFDLSRKYSIATIVKETKRTSSAWIKVVSPSCKKFHWQNGYGAFSVSQSHLDRFVYILGDKNNIIGALIRMSSGAF
jgi:REP element-mobilizing transposase RayT